MHKQRTAIMAGSVLGLVGAVTPWAKIVIGSKASTFYGIRGPGIVTALCFSLVLVMTLLGNRHNPLGFLRRALTSLFGIGALAVAGWNLTHLGKMAGVVGHGSVSIGYGVYLTLIAAAIVVLVPWAIGRRN